MKPGFIKHALTRRPFSIRLWILGGIVSLVVVPFILIALLAAVSELFSPNYQSVPSRPYGIEQLRPFFQRVEAESSRWDDPQWQGELERELAQRQLEVVLLRADGTQLFPVLRPGVNYPSRHTDEGYVIYGFLGPQFREAHLYQGDKPAGQAIWLHRSVPADPTVVKYQSNRNDLIPFAIFAVIIATLWAAIWLASRSVLNPLRSLAGAAEKIIRGELDFSVPHTRIKEINEFSEAFDQMRLGLKESLEKQADMEQERRMFIAAMAHDLRTPLTSVRGYLEGLRDGVATTPEKVEHYVSVALEKAGSLERLIESLFAFTKTEYLNQPPQIEWLELGDLLDRAVTGIRPRAEAKGVKVNMDAGPLRCQFGGDPFMLARVIDNLLDNALRYTPTGGIISVGWRGGTLHCRFWIQDTGPGIPLEDLGRVFQPLYRSDRARGTRTGGAGLGLAIVKRLVEAHGGEIIVENFGGARFVVTLPIKAESSGS